jgi:hypothetical protein
VDREWYEIDGMDQEFPNLEAASVVAERMANEADREVCICRYVQTAVRRYRRQVTVTSEDITPTA